MIFTTMAEEKRVMGIIRDRKLFDDLTREQNEAIWGAYRMIETVQAWATDYQSYDGKAMYENMLDEYLTHEVDTALMGMMESDIADMYVSFSDQNAEEENKDE